MNVVTAFLWGIEYGLIIYQVMPHLVRFCLTRLDIHLLAMLAAAVGMLAVLVSLPVMVTVSSSPELINNQGSHADEGD